MLPTVVWLTPFAALALSLALVVPLLLKVYRRCNPDEITAEWLESFSSAAYYPMENLLADDDFRFLSQQPGFDLYLSRLILDFNRLHTAARLLLAHGSTDRSDILTQLIMLKLKFSGAVIRAELSYCACRVGFKYLAARAMIKRLEEMNTHLVAINSASQFA